MKKLALIVLAALMMVGCHDWNSTYKVDTKRDGTLYGTIMIDSREYIRGNNRLAHKGNCRFCQERMRKLMMEVRDSLLRQVE